MTSLDCTNKAYLTKIITKLYDERLLEFDKGAAEVKITPKGSQAAEKLIGTLAKAPSTP
jgi:predicted transcriptional regulator